MQYNYEPMSETDAQRKRFQLLDNGIYNAIVTKAEGKASAKGNAMAVLDLEVIDKEGKKHPVTDYLVFMDSMMWKIRHFCYAAGIDKEYEQKKFHHDLAVNKQLRVKIITKVGSLIPSHKLEGKLLGSKYPDKNVIEDYVMDEMQNSFVPLTQSKRTAAEDISDFDDKDLPF